MAKCRSRLLMTATITCALAASGCIVANQTGQGTGLQDGQTVSGGLTGTSQSGSTIRGDVKLPPSHLASTYRVSALTNVRAASGASVTLRDYKMDQVPNAPTVKTNGEGKFSLNRVPADNVWVVTANHAKGLAANLVYVAPKKVANTSLTLGSTLAVSAVLPLFVPDEQTKDAVKMGEIDLVLFEKLVKAIDAMLTNDTLIPAETTMKAYRKHFTGLKTGAVLDAYNALVDDLKKKGAVNPNPDATTGEGIGENPDPDATDAAQPEESEGSEVTDPETPAVTYDPIVGSAAEVAGVTIGGSSAMQMAKMQVEILNVLLVPDDDKMHAFTNPTSAPTTRTGADMGVAFTGAKAMATKDMKIYTIATVDGKPSLVVIQPGATDPMDFTATAKELTGELTGSITGLVYSTEKSAWLAVDEGRDVVVTITEGGEVAVYAGAPDSTGADAGADTAGEIRFNQPTSIAKVGSKIYVTDSFKHRVVEIDLSNDQAKVAAGFSEIGIINGPPSDARFQKPSGIAPVTGGGLAIADRTNEALRHLDVANKKVVSYTDPDRGEANTGKGMIPFPRSVIEYSDKLMVVISEGKLWTWSK